MTAVRRPDPERKYDIVGIGASLYDFLLEATEYPVEDTKMKLDGLRFHCGGPAATGLVTAARMGAKTAFFGTFTDDFYSKTMLDDFVRWGVDISFIHLKPGFIAGSAFVVNSKKTSSRTVFWTSGTLPSPKSDEVPEELIAKSRLLYLDGNHLDAAVQACTIAHKQGVKVFLDAGTPYRGIEKIVEMTDILIASESFAINFGEGGDAETGAANINRRFRPEILIVTQGDRGGFIFDRVVSRRYPCFTAPGPIISTNGAGDVFHGAFAYLYLQDKPLKDCVLFASATAAIKCTKPFGREGIPMRSEVEKFLSLGAPDFAE